MARRVGLGHIARTWVCTHDFSFWVPMTRLLLVLSFLTVLLPSLGAAQDRTWLQLEAQRSLLSAEERVRDYAGFLPDVKRVFGRRGLVRCGLGPL